MPVIRFGDNAAPGQIPTEQAFRRNIGRSSLKRHLKRSNVLLDAIYAALRKVHANPNHVAAVRKVRRACADWINKYGVGPFKSKKGQTEIQVLFVGKAANERYYSLVERSYLDRGRQDKLDAAVIGAKISDGVKIMKETETGKRIGKQLGSEYSYERHTAKHVSNHIVSEKEWRRFTTKYSSRLGFEDWVELIAIPDREDGIGAFGGPTLFGTAAELRKGVQYLSDAGREDYRLEFYAGLLRTTQTRRFVDPENPLPPPVMQTLHTGGMGGSSGACFGIFVIDFDHELYAGQPTSSKFHHSSFLSGAPVYSAGEIAVNRGEVVGITNKTGHYKSGRVELYRALCVLKAMGVNLNNVVCQDRGLKQSKWRDAEAVWRARGNFDDPQLQRTPERNAPNFR